MKNKRVQKIIAEKQILDHISVLKISGCFFYPKNILKRILTPSANKSRQLTLKLRHTESNISSSQFVDTNKLPEITRF